MKRILLLIKRLTDRERETGKEEKLLLRSIQVLNILFYIF